jgi:hypothetical protein
LDTRSIASAAYVLALVWRFYRPKAIALAVVRVSASYAHGRAPCAALAGATPAVMIRAGMRALATTMHGREPGLQHGRPGPEFFQREVV